MLPMPWLGTSLWGMQSHVLGRPAGVSAATEAAVIRKVMTAVLPLHVVPGPSQCLTFRLAETTAKFYDVQVRENHNPPECHGDPETGPRVADVRVDRRTGRMKWDYALGNPDMDFVPLPKPQRKSDR